MQIPLAHQRTYALERYYYEFIQRMGPAHLLYEQFVKTMENFGKPYFTVPSSYSGYPEEIAFVFKIEGENYIFDHVRTQDEILRKYDPSIKYKPGGNWYKCNQPIRARLFILFRVYKLISELDFWISGSFVRHKMCQFLCRISSG